MAHVVLQLNLIPCMASNFWRENSIVFARLLINTDTTQLANARGAASANVLQEENTGSEDKWRGMKLAP
jgi:hypothetical protein